MLEVNLTKQNFTEEVLNSKIPVIVDFWATWCGPCKMLAPVLEQVAEEYEGKIKVCKVNVDEEQDLAMEFQIMSIPTLLFFKSGEIAKTSVGFVSKSELKEIIDTL